MPEKQFPESYNSLRGLLDKLGKELPGPKGGFVQLHKQAVAEGGLSTKSKELTDLAISVAVRCEGCVAFHTHDALKAGASRQEVVETGYFETQAVTVPGPVVEQRVPQLDDEPRPRPLPVRRPAPRPRAPTYGFAARRAGCFQSPSLSPALRGPRV